MKAKARAADPTWDTEERTQRRVRMLAETAGLSQARISQIENGTATTLETLRAYVTGLGGHLDIVARIGNLQLNVA